jgi:hypothetical protein
MDPVRRLGLAALVGGAGLVLADVFLQMNPGAPDLESTGDYLTVGVLAVSVLLTLGGLFGVQLRQRDVYGRLGQIGLALAVVGHVAAGVLPVRLNEWVLLAGLAGLIGFLLLALAIARAPALPHWTGFLLFAGFVGFLIVRNADLGIALYGATWLVVGYALRAGWAETLPEARPLQA